MIYPNVRGSSGYGRTFRNLDNGLRREDAVRDIGALLDWIRRQPDLDAGKVMVQGASYGGYLALMVASEYSDRIAGAISDSGMSNLASSAAGTPEGWRRAYYRGEFGDERDAQMRAFMERTAPVNRAARIRKPLLIVQGARDPRVPVGEAEQIVAAVRRNNTPVWYLLGRDEGHNFAQQDNRNFRLLSTILFVREHLLR